MTDPCCLALLTDPTGAPLPAGLSALRVDGITAILAALPPQQDRSRRAVLQDAAQRMALLEGLLPCGTILPLLPSARLSPAAARTAIPGNRGVIDEARRILTGKVQYQLTIRWPEADALDHFRAAGFPFGTAATLPDLAQRFRTMVQTCLADCGCDLLALPAQFGTVVNLALLLDPGDEHRLDRALGAIDAVWSEGLAIRLTGPTPGVSFASLDARRIDAAAVAEARGLLALGPGATPDDIRSARRRALLSASPAQGAAISRAAEVLSVGAASGWTGDLVELSLWSEDRAAPEPVRGAA